MELYIVRHGAAVNVGDQGITRDEDRILSPAGRKKTTEVARGLANMGVRPERIGSSPLPRALETAHLIAEVLGPQEPVELCDFLRPGATAGDVIKWLHKAGVESAMVVGHMPDVAAIAAALFSSGATVATVFKKAAVCCVSFDEAPELGKGDLEWLMQPAQLRVKKGKK